MSVPFELGTWGCTQENGINFRSLMISYFCRATVTNCTVNLAFDRFLMVINLRLMCSLVVTREPAERRNRVTQRCNFFYLEHLHLQNDPDVRTHY